MSRSETTSTETAIVPHEGPVVDSEERPAAPHVVIPVSQNKTGATSGGLSPLSHGKPVLLDLFCAAGGCTAGYQRAGFYVVGVDVEPQPRYCGDEFVQMDALAFMEGVFDFGWMETNEGLRYYNEDFDAIHASPPCPRYSSITAVSGNREDHPDLIDPTRELLEQTGLPWVIENVPRSPLRNPVTICGVAMGLTIVEDGERFVLRRHRLFETNFPVMVSPCACHRAAGTVLGLYGGGTRQDSRKEANTGGGNTRKANRAQGHALMETPWMTRTDMVKAIPPAYTELIGYYLLAAIREGAKAA